MPLLGRRVGGFWLLHHGSPWVVLVVLVIVILVVVYLQRRR